LPDARLLIVGRVDTDDPESAGFYARLLGDFEGRPGIQAVPGYVPFNRLATYLLASDVVALPYVKSYTSGVLLWAYAAGRPVVVTSTGGLAESVDVGKSGFVVPPRDSRALAEALVGVIQSPSRSDAMGDYARNLAETRYSWPTAAAQTLKLYRELLGRPAEDALSAQTGATPGSEGPGSRRAFSR
jgi:glycosyltransferase involved in cell wall biosynthesis